MNSSPDTAQLQNQLALRYQRALQTFLSQSRRFKIEGVRKLGGDAIPIGLEILDLARIHEQAMGWLVPAKSTSKARTILIKRAGRFFAEAILPNEKTHQQAQEKKARVTQFVQSLDERTLELNDSVQTLSKEILGRKEAEQSLRASEQTLKQLLEKSRRMQVELRELSHQLLKAQEDERMKISRELHDVIAQTLTGINVQLDILKKQSSTDNKQLHQKISHTQLMVEKSVDIVHRFACELRPTVLDDLGLIPALKSYMKGFIAETGIRLSLNVSAGIEKASSSIRTALYRVAQEALANVSRHAQASQASVCAYQHPKRWDNHEHFRQRPWV